VTALSSSRSARVEQLTTAAYTVPTDAPEADGTFAWDCTTLVLVRASSEGETGTGWTYAPAATTAIVAEALAPVVRGCPAMDVAAAWGSMVRHVRNSGRHGLVGYAISAVDVALWDLKARLLGLPLHRLLGAVRTDVPVYGSGGFTTYDERQLAQQLARWTVEQRIPRVKIKIGESWGSCVDRDVERMRQARAAIGDDVELFVDANGAYGAAQAIRVMDDVSDLDVRWFEEPVSSDDLAGLRHVRERVRADVAAGEYAGDLFEARRLCESGGVDCLQLDVSRVGGISEWLRGAAVAASYNLQVSGHCGPHLHAHVAAATPNLRHLEWFHDHERIETMLFDGTLDPSGGTVTPRDDVLGNGLTFRDDVAEPYRVTAPADARRAPS
jgi:L-alanine-DL-glutamate epimerase-like enolase superfamily enzyme